MNGAERDTVVGSGFAGDSRSRSHQTWDRAFFSGQTVGTIAGARRLIRSANSEADRQARPLVINARG